MLTIRPELQQLNPLAMSVKDPRHITSGGAVGFKGSYDHGGAMTDLRAKKGRGADIAELGTEIGANSVLRDGSLGANGMNRDDPASFANAMLKAIDKVSALNNRAEDLHVQAIIDPDSVDIHDITLAQSEASMALDMSATILSRLTQAWKDLINIR
jgi:flagellar hook-basal body complex protein FliE